jgi:propanediol dehydratase small subunit
MRRFTAEADYPMMARNRKEIFTPNGKNIDEITFENIDSGLIGADDCRTGKQSLLAQADIAESRGNIHIARNFRRAAELVDIDSDRIIEIYNALRPYRSTERELEEIATELSDRYSALRTAAFVREAAVILKKRKKLKDDR